MKTDNDAEQQARAHWDTIYELETAAGTDWDRLEELRDCEPEELTGSDLEELEGLTAEAAGYESREDVEERIQEYPLSVEVREGWKEPGTVGNLDDFQILLCTGGPAVRIRGELNNGEPCRAWIEYQDWGTPWMQFFDANQSVLVDFCSRFYFGG